MVNVAQVWKCDKCQTEYHSPLVISSVTCPKRGCRENMKFTDGKPPRWMVEKEKRDAAKRKRTTRARATKVSSPDDLLKLLGDKG